MPSPEAFLPAQVIDQRLAWQEVPATSPHMQAVVTHLATAAGIDLTQKGAQFQLDEPAHARQWLMANIDGERIGVTRCQVDQERGLTPDLDMVFAVTPDGWEPIELVHAEGPWDEFTQAAQAQELTVFDPQGNLRYALFTEFWAQQIEQTGGTQGGSFIAGLKG